MIPRTVTVLLENDLVDGCKVGASAPLLAVGPPQRRAARVGTHAARPRRACAQAGDDVVVTGVVMQRWIRTIREKRCDVELVIRANHIRHNNAVTSSALPGEGVLAWRFRWRRLLQPAHLCPPSATDLEQEFREFWARHAANPLRGRNILVGSICPQVYGLFLVRRRAHTPPAPLFTGNRGR